MRIVPQFAAVSYSSFLALPAPNIAGLLPARAESLHRNAPRKAEPFTFADPRLVDLSDKTRVEFDKLAATLLRATVGLLTDDLTESEFALTGSAFLRQAVALYHGAIIGNSKPVDSPFARARQRLDDQLADRLTQSKAHLVETRDRIACELAALHTEEP